MSAPEQSRLPKRSCNSFAVLADLPTSSGPSIHVVADADTTETATAAHMPMTFDGHSPVRPHSMTLRTRRMNGAKAAAHSARPIKRKTSGHATCKHTSSRQEATKQKAARLADSRSASQQQPADGQQKAHGERDDIVAAPKTEPLSRPEKRKCPSALDAGRPLTRRRTDQGGHRTVRRKRKRRDSQCNARQTTNSPTDRRTRKLYLEADDAVCASQVDPLWGGCRSAF